jgi:hypothetical protein
MRWERDSNNIVQALHLACHEDHGDVVRVLLANSRSDVNYSVEGRTPFDFATETFESTESAAFLCLHPKWQAQLALLHSIFERTDAGSSLQRLIDCLFHHFTPSECKAFMPMLMPKSLILPMRMAPPSQQPCKKICAVNCKKNPAQASAPRFALARFVPLLAWQRYAVLTAFF